MRKHLRPILAVGLTVAALGVLLGVTQGSQTDPLVTMSYINDVAAPKILADVDSKLNTREQALVDKLNAQIAAYEKEMEEKLSGTTGAGAVPATSAYAVVTVKSGQKLTLGVGGELILRAGTATCVAASAPGLLDVTDGSTLESAQPVAPNHLYLSTAEGRGLQATADATVLVRGTYTVA